MGPRSDKMDQLNAHLDRGWDLVAKGDTRGARESAQRAIDLDGNSPEAHNLFGYVSAAEGESDDALSHYRQAMALDDGYLDPLLNAAEVLVYPLGEFDEAIALCDEALEFAEDRDEITDALLLKFDALMGKGESAAAEKCLDQVPAGPFHTANPHFLIGRGRYELGQIDRALPELLRAAEVDPLFADAHYYLGLIAEEKGDREAAVDRYLRVRDLDDAAPRVPWTPPRDHFLTAVKRAMADVPEPLRSRIAHARLLLADLPAPELIADLVDPRIPILLDGVASDASGDPTAVARVVVYQRNIERSCPNYESLREEIAKTLTREIEAAFAPPEREAADGRESRPSSVPAK